LFSSSATLNTAETTTLVPIITAFADRHDLTDVPIVFAADAGMLSAANLAVHWNGDVFTDGQIIDTVTPRHGACPTHGVKSPAAECRMGLGYCGTGSRPDQIDKIVGLAARDIRYFQFNYCRSPLIAESARRVGSQLRSVGRLKLIVESER
jgi:hypothetical protein